MRKISFALLILALLLAACGAPAATAPEAAEAQDTADEAVAEDSNLVEEGAFPVTIAHKYGETTISARPERIVLVGLTEQDALLALGVVPVATREWYGEKPGAIFPWAESYLGEAALPVVLSSAELNFEQIAGLDPDLIVGLYAAGQISPMVYGG